MKIKKKKNWNIGTTSRRGGGRLRTSITIYWMITWEKEIKFIIQDDFGLDPKVCYCAKILLDDELLAKSKAKSKKKAEEKAAKIATRILKIAPTPIHAYNGK